MLASGAVSACATSPTAGAPLKPALEARAPAPGTMGISRWRFWALTATSRPLSNRTFMQPCTSGNADDVCGKITPHWPLSSTCLLRPESSTLLLGGSFSKRLWASSNALPLSFADASFFLSLLLEDARFRLLLCFLLRPRLFDLALGLR